MQGDGDSGGGGGSHRHIKIRRWRKVWLQECKGYCRDSFTCIEVTPCKQLTEDPIGAFGL